MITRSFLKRHEALVAQLDSLIEEDPALFDPPLPPDMGECEQREDVDGLGSDDAHAVPEALDDSAFALGAGEHVFYHATSRIHLQRHLLARPEVKQMLAELCAHYARVCRIALVHFSLMDNHFHLELGHSRQSICSVSKMVGCIKQQFTNRFKHWYNGEYRKARRYRVPMMGKGTLWDGPCHLERIEDERQLLACSLYIEANRIKATGGQELARLDCAPRLDPHSERLQPEYEAILEQIRNFPFHSARYYLAATGEHEDVLTDGLDSVWATREEFEVFWPLPCRRLPAGWRKVWFKGYVSILKPTQDSKRRRLEPVFWRRLGRCDAGRARRFGYLLMESCWRSMLRHNPDHGPEGGPSSGGIDQAVDYSDFF
jgi:REP element-mobilizing transposase RayT